MQLIKLIDIKALMLAFAIGAITPLILVQLTLSVLSNLGSTNAYLEGSILLYAIYFIAIPFGTGYIASRLAKQLPYYHGAAAVLLFTAVAYMQAEPIYWWVGAVQVMVHAIAGVFGIITAGRRPRA